MLTFFMTIVFGYLAIQIIYVGIVSTGGHVLAYILNRETDKRLEALRVAKQKKDEESKNLQKSPSYSSLGIRLDDPAKE